MENWKNIDGYEGLYEVSDAGRIKSHRGSEIKLRPALNGYLRVWLYRKSDFTYKPFTAHRLVAEAFIPNPENKPFVNHKNGNKMDNNVKNLEWCTQSENQLHAFRTGLQVGNKGSRNGQAKLTELQVAQIRSASVEYKNHQQIADKYGVSRRTINRIINNSIWK